MGTIKTENKNRTKKGKLWFYGGKEREYLNQLDEMEILKDILLKRTRTKTFVGDMSIYRIVDGHKLKFTQRQTRALLIYVEEVTNDGKTD